MRNSLKLARGLGWFSIGLGVAQIVAPRRVARIAGVRDGRTITRAVGVREIATGVGILSGKALPAALWARVAGDVMDLGLLGAAFRARRSKPARVAAATAAVAGVTALDYYCSRALGQRQAADRAVRVARQIAIDRSAPDLYRFWRDFQNLPKVMRHVERVEVRDERRSHWVVRGPGEVAVEWDAEIVEDAPNTRLAWRTLPGADVEHGGTVDFRRAPAGRGTIVAVELTYRPGAGAASYVAWLAGLDPGRRIADDLRRLKQLMETGEIATSAGPSARATARAR